MRTVLMLMAVMSYATTVDANSIRSNNKLNHKPEVTAAHFEVGREALRRHRRSPIFLPATPQVQEVHVYPHLPYAQQYPYSRYPYQQPYAGYQQYYPQQAQQFYPQQQPYYYQQQYYGGSQYGGGYGRPPYGDYRRSINRPDPMETGLVLGATAVGGALLLGGLSQAFNTGK